MESRNPINYDTIKFYQICSLACLFVTIINSLISTFLILHNVLFAIPNQQQLSRYTPAFVVMALLFFGIHKFFKLTLLTVLELEVCAILALTPSVNFKVILDQDKNYVIEFYPQRKLKSGYSYDHSPSRPFLIYFHVNNEILVLLKVKSEKTTILALFEEKKQISGWTRT